MAEGDSDDDDDDDDDGGMDWMSGPPDGQPEMEIVECDVAIIGGGPAGATCALYTNYLLVNLHTEFRKWLAANKNDPRSDDPHYIVSYHDIMGGLIGPKSKTFALLVVILALYGLSVVQIISTGSNMYLLYDGLSKCCHKQDRHL